MVWSSRRYVAVLFSFVTAKKAPFRLERQSKPMIFRLSVFFSDAIAGPTGGKDCEDRHADFLPGVLPKARTFRGRTEAGAKLAAAARKTESD